MHCLLPPSNNSLPERHLQEPCAATPIPESTTGWPNGLPIAAVGSPYNVDYFEGNPRCNFEWTFPAFGMEYGWEIQGGCNEGTWPLNEYPPENGDSTFYGITGSCEIADRIWISSTCNFTENSMTLNWWGEGASEVLVKVKGGVGGKLYDTRGMSGGTFTAGPNSVNGLQAGIAYMEMCINCVPLACYDEADSAGLPPPGWTPPGMEPFCRIWCPSLP